MPSADLVQYHDDLGETSEKIRNLGLDRKIFKQIERVLAKRAESLGLELSEFIGEKPSNEDELKNLSRRWHVRFEAQLDRIKDDPEATYEDLVDVVWQYGILDHIAPVLPREALARKERGKDVWNREDPRLYWRILYSAAALKEFSERGWTISGGGYTLPGIAPAFRMLFLERRDLISENKDPVISLAESVMEKARTELQIKGVNLHEKLIPFEGEGVIDGIPVRVNRYCKNGTVYLFSRDPRFEDLRNRLVEVGELGISPEKINPGDFQEESRV